MWSLQPWVKQDSVTCQNKTAAIKIRVIADLYLPFPQQKNWVGHSTQCLTYFQDIYLSFKFD